MAARNKMFSIDFKQFEEYGEKLEKVGVEILPAVSDAMEKAGQKVQEDVLDAVQSQYLPNKGAYSHGDTERSVITSPQVEWSGLIGELPLGFDKTMPGAGGFLITGTPKMQPDKKLADIFQSKKYKSEIVRQIREELQRVVETAAAFK